ncbi:MAG: ThiF family adenylyltransferase, partial [Oscillospiraceae bacterium]|nr:ThiF family adenylyltransferase [Oscillospiraceae bacterium]
MKKNTAHLAAAEKEWILTEEVYRQISSTIGRHLPEQGGILGSSDMVHVDHYYYDAKAAVTGVSYTSDTDTLNQVIADWNSRGITFVGVIHSHPHNYNMPSQGDAQIARQIIECMDVGGRLFTPIVSVDPSLDGTITIHPYSFKQEIELKHQPMSVRPDPRPADRSAIFQRVAGILPPEVMRRKKVICIGLGGSRPFLEDLARCGVGIFVLMDGDKVEASNIATQGVRYSEIGSSKALSVQRSLENINPEVQVITIERYLEDSISDREFADLTGLLTHSASDTLLCGCTDNFQAQDRCAQLAMKYGIPYLAAQVYQQGMGSEIIFTYPGVTQSCPRCMLEGRYRRAMEQQEEVDGKSQGSPICTTTKLNGEKCDIALKMLLYYEPSTPYAHKLDEIAQSNFLMSRHTKAFSQLGVTLFDGFDAADQELEVMDITVAIRQTPNEGCPLCGGHGDLRRLIGH